MREEGVKKRERVGPPEKKKTSTTPNQNLWKTGKIVRGNN